MCLCHFLLINNDKVQVLGIGKKAVLAYMVDENKSVFLFNIGCTQMEYLLYSLLEALKDKIVI